MQSDCSTLLKSVRLLLWLCVWSGQRFHKVAPGTPLALQRFDKLLSVPVPLQQ